MKKILLILILILAMLLTSCSTSSDSSQTSQESETKELVADESDPVARLASSDELTLIEGNTITLKDDGTGEDVDDPIMKKIVSLTNRQIDYVIEAGSFTITINSVQLADVEFPTSESASLFNLEAGDTATLFAIDMTVENTSDETLSIYTDQSTIVTNTKDQVTNDLLVSDEVGGEFKGQVIKTGQIFFYVKNATAADITSIKWYVDAPLDTDLEKMCDDIVVNFNFVK